MSDHAPRERITQERIIRLFQEELDYASFGNLQYEEDNRNIMESWLLKYLALAGYEATVARKAVRELQKIARDQNLSLFDKNKELHGKLRYGISVKKDVSSLAETVQFINWQQPQANHFYIAEEVTIKGEKEKRPDVVLYVNGIALAVLELKRASGDIGDGINQSIRNQEPGYIGDFFATVQFVLAGNDSQGLRYGTTGTATKWFLEWKEDVSDNSRLQLDKYLLKMFSKERFLELIYDFIVFDGPVKKLPRPHQYFGIKAAQEFVQRREGGIIWHTQGSGKSLVMVMLARWILENLPQARVAIITDRTELDKQIRDVFHASGEKSIERASSGQDLLDKLAKPTPRLICSLVHKFGKKGKDQDFSEYLREIKAGPRAAYGELFLFVDECHRTQSGKLHQVMKALLPEAVFIGFTGTPLLKKDKSTSLEVFGRYIHTYKFNEAVRDGIVRDLVYEARDIEQRLSSPERVDEWFTEKTRGLNAFQQNALKKQWATMRQVLSSASRMEKIVADITHDFGTRPRLTNGKGNAILVAGSIYEACRYYDLFGRRGNRLRGKCAVVTSYNPNQRDVVHEATGENTETEKEFIYNLYTDILREVKDLPGKNKTEVYEDEVKARFIKQPNEMQLLIVVDKLLTGFDAPPCTYLYIDKQMQDHGLFQAITRVNRLDGEDKLFGYIVDYKKLFSKVYGAIEVYTEELDVEGFNKEDIEILIKDRLTLGREKLEAARDEIALLLEPVPPPREYHDFQRYLVGNPELPRDIEDRKPQRTAFYRAAAGLLRAYANIADDLSGAGYSVAQGKQIKRELDEYMDLRQSIQKAAGETFDSKAYEADMRYLIDNYIEAEHARKLHDFGDMTLLDIIENEGIQAAIGSLGKQVLSSPEAVAEAIENNIRRKIIKEHLVDPVYFDDMSAILTALIQQRREGAIDYKKYLEELESLAKKTNRGNTKEVPEDLSRPEQRALLGQVDNDADLARTLDAAIRKGSKADWRGNPAKEQELKQQLWLVLNDEREVERIFLFLQDQMAY